MCLPSSQLNTDPAVQPIPFPRNAACEVARAARRAAMAVGVSASSDGAHADRARGGWTGAELWARIVCNRLREARQLNGFTVEQASERIGYAPGSKTQISLMENGERFPPIRVLISAAIVYGVPLDYLFGLIDEDEVHEFGLERAALTSQVEAMLTRSALAVSEVATEALQAGLPSVQMARSLVEQTQRWIHAFDRFKARNRKQFDELPAGALLETAAVELAVAALDAERTIQRHDTLAQRAAERTEKRLAAARRDAGIPASNGAVRG